MELFLLFVELTYKPVARIFCGRWGGGGGGATEAKVDQTIEVVLSDCLSCLSFIVAVQRNCNG